MDGGQILNRPHKIVIFFGCWAVFFGHGRHGRHGKYEELWERNFFAICLMVATGLGAVVAGLVVFLPRKPLKTRNFFVGFVAIHFGAALALIFWPRKARKTSRTVGAKLFRDLLDGGHGAGCCCSWLGCFFATKTTKN